ncbi:LpqB family beta-propeller domain-containing protein [Nocardioides cynanchi]|uniref:LpqB family beta-propeller domain-containing protein n=1 Tax=Nocardioides cynanchi TaxID=2558918 RepID=UPI0012451F50|nr:LpqB family beta-propeller domain-containing protein [Nocardioides cynanchi]
MRPGRTTSSVAGMLAALTLAMLLSSCVRLPETGPVVVSNQQGLTSPVEGPYSDPRRPQAHATPGQIVTGFLNAMTAVPLQTQVARQYLTAAGRARWQPKRGMVVYDDTTLPRGSSTVSVTLRGAQRIDGRSMWRGALAPGTHRTAFPMRLEHGEWRINRAPDALLVPSLWFEQHFATVSVYFFDPLGRILVPELVHVPTGDQFTTALVRALVLGPSRSLTGAIRSYIPPGLASGLTVTLQGGGLADIVMRGPAPAPLSEQSTAGMVTQFAATLAQVPGIATFRLTIAGAPVSDGTGATVFPVGVPARADPSVSRGSALVYALRRGLLVSGQAKGLTKLDGPFGTAVQGIASFAVSLNGVDVAATTPDTLLVGPVQNNGSATTVLEGAGPLLRPAWDFAGRLWDIEAAPGGAIVDVITNGKRHRVRVPGVSGHDVRRFLVSRDGSRLVAVIHGAASDRIVVSRLRYATRGRVVGATRAQRLPWQAGGTARVRDIGWLSPTSIAVLHLLTRDVSEVRDLAIDGSTPASEAVTTPFAGRAKGLATSPVENETSYAVLPGNLLDLAQVDPAVRYSHVRQFTYAG